MGVSGPFPVRVGRLPHGTVEPGADEGVTVVVCAEPDGDDVDVGRVEAEVMGDGRDTHGSRMQRRHGVGQPSPQTLGSCWSLPARLARAAGPLIRRQGQASQYHENLQLDATSS